jgi:positive regulator of sigma E activity
MLLRALVAFVLITPLVVAAKLLLSPLAAVLTAVIGVALYVWFFFAYRRAHNPHPGQRLPPVTSQWQRWRAE